MRKQPVFKHGESQHIIFENTGSDFSAYSAATARLKKNGYSVGSSQRGNPIGFLKGEGIYISKRSGMNKQEIQELDGYIRSINSRNGQVAIYMKNQFNTPTAS